jgi:hypothetical protein
MSQDRSSAPQGPIADTLAAAGIAVRSVDAHGQVHIDRDDVVAACYALLGRPNPADRVTPEKTPEPPRHLPPYAWPQNQRKAPS